MSTWMVYISSSSAGVIMGLLSVYDSDSVTFPVMRMAPVWSTVTFSGGIGGIVQ